MTVVVEFSPGDPGSPPHRHFGPCFGYVLEGEMLYEVEGESPRIVRAGEAFWEPGGDVIHYSNGNNRNDIWLRYAVTMLCEPGKPMLVYVDKEELISRKNRRVSRGAGRGSGEGTIHGAGVRAGNAPRPSRAARSARTAAPRYARE